MRVALIRFPAWSAWPLFCSTVPLTGKTFSKIGPHWEWSLPDSKEKVTTGTFTGWVTGTVTVGKGKTEKDRTKIGQWSSPAPNEYHVIIDKALLAGTSRVKLTKSKAPVLEGELEHKDGKKEKVIFRLFKD